MESFGHLSIFNVRTFRKHTLKAQEETNEQPVNTTDRDSTSIKLAMPPDL